MDCFRRYPLENTSVLLLKTCRAGRTIRPPSIRSTRPPGSVLIHPSSYPLVLKCHFLISFPFPTPFLCLIPFLIRLLVIPFVWASMSLSGLSASSHEERTAKQRSNQLGIEQDLSAPTTNERGFDLNQIQANLRVDDTRKKQT